MKQPLFIAGLFAIVLISCQSESKPEISKSDSTAAKESIVYPFTPKYSINWRPGDEKNALIVLNCLKHYVDGDMKGTFADMADTVDFYSDGFHFHGSKDSLQAIIGAERNSLASVSKVFDTWLTAFYPDNGETWVTLWYTEIMTDKKGKTDSLFYVDDVLLRDGKIKEYDAKLRHFPKLPAIK